MLNLSQRYQSLVEKIPSEVTLIAVSKKQPIESIEHLYQLGQRDFGENYVQELVQKAEILAKKKYEGIRWHFIGHLQTNKIKLLIPYVNCVHTIDSQRLAIQLAERWNEAKRTGCLDVFMEVNLDQEPNKSGYSPHQVLPAAEQIAGLNSLQLLGLMCIPSVHENSKSRFEMLKRLENQCRPFTRGMLSMGMSSDFELAIQEGATHVRVGTSLFGDRLIT